jgi:hypothetical protein
VNDGGSASLELALGILVLMFPVALAIMSFGPWMERTVFARQAAAELSRSVVIAEGDTEGALGQIAAMVVNHGYGPGDVRVGLCGAAPTPVIAGGATACPPTLSRGAAVRARVEVEVPLVVLPWSRGGDPVTVGGLAVSAEHESLVDLYRSAG